MIPFEKSAAYYDLFYQDKNYIGEAEYIHRLIQAFGNQTVSILDLGCGTGRHDIALEKLGYEISGVDFSQEMVDIVASGKSGLSNISFDQGDIRTIRLNKKFQVVLSLFAVLGYKLKTQTWKQSLKQQIII